jgi:hypothetical protein
LDSSRATGAVGGGRRLIRGEPERRSCAGLIRQPRLKIYPDAAHGFLLQHYAQFAAGIDASLEEAK